MEKNQIRNHEKLLYELEEFIEKKRNNPKYFTGIISTLLADILFEIDRLKIYYKIE